MHTSNVERARREYIYSTGIPKPHHRMGIPSPVEKSFLVNYTGWKRTSALNHNGVQRMQSRNR